MNSVCARMLNIYWIFFQFDSFILHLCLVPTTDTTRASWILEQMVKIKRPVLLVGDSGTSKTATIHNFLKNLNADRMVSWPFNHIWTQSLCPLSLNYSPFTSRLHWWLTSHPEQLHWTSRGTWRPMLRKGLKRSTVLLWGRDCWSSWMT